MTYNDISPEWPDNFWTIALVRNEPGHNEVHFGIFNSDEVREAMLSGKVTCHEDEHLELRRIRAFPK